MVNVLLTHQGTMAGSDEIFVHTLSVITPTADLLAIAGQARTAFQTAWNAADPTARNTFGDTMTWQQVGAAEILNLTEGDLSAAMHAQFVPPVPVGGGASGAYQNAMVISLTAGTRPNGTPLRGRFYLPGNAEGAIDDGRFAAINVTAVGGFVEEWLAALIAQGLEPAVWSRTLGVLQPVTAARVGNTVDTQRRRRNALAETYTPITIV